MIIVSILSETGAFNFLGFWAFKITGGKVWPLIGALCTITAIVSAFLDNVTTILLMTPVVIQLCESINIDPGEKTFQFYSIFVNITFLVPHPLLRGGTLVVPKTFDYIVLHSPS